MGDQEAETKRRKGLANEIIRRVNAAGGGCKD
jgi:hypothetical protein